MSFAGSKIEAALLISAALAINIGFFYGLATKPVIEYNISTPLDYNGTVDFDSEELYVSLEIRNRGSSPARITLAVRLYNCTLMGPGGLETYLGDGFTEISIPSTEPIRRSEDREHTITIEPEGNVTHALLIFLIRVQPRLDPMTGFYESFTTVKPERPTALLLKHIDGEKFMRVRSR